MLALSAEGDKETLGIEVDGDGVLAWKDERGSGLAVVVDTND